MPWDGEQLYLSHGNGVDLNDTEGIFRVQRERSIKAMDAVDYGRCNWDGDGD